MNSFWSNILTRARVGAPAATAKTDKIESGLLKLAMFFWVELPIWLARIFPQFANTLTDGQHLLRWPTLAALSPFVALTLGMVIELFQQDEIFSMSWIVIGVLTLIGVFVGATRCLCVSGVCRS